MHSLITLCPNVLSLEKYVGASLSGTSELDMKFPQRRHYNELLVGPKVYNLTLRSTAWREKRVSQTGPIRLMVCTDIMCIYTI